MRENELHEPIVETLRSIYTDIISVQISCSVCKEILLITHWQANLWKSELGEEYLQDFAASELKNYCQNCGARLKEIEE